MEHLNHPLPIAYGYFRISMDKENIDNQVFRFKEICQQNGWAEGRCFYEVEHGHKERPILDNVINEASLHRFDILVVFALDRLTRGGVQSTIYYLDIFRRYQVRIYSMERGFHNIETAEDELHASVDGYYGRKEREKISARTKNALENIRREIELKGYAISRRSGKRITQLGAVKGMIGKKGERHMLTPQEEASVVRLYYKHTPISEIARQSNMSRGTIHRILSEKGLLV
jgi:DNA invertase Pin-like site-specific DNA recombinase